MVREDLIVGRVLRVDPRVELAVIKVGVVEFPTMVALLFIDDTMLEKFESDDVISGLRRTRERY